MYGVFSPTDIAIEARILSILPDTALAQLLIQPESDIMPAISDASLPYAKDRSSDGH